MSAWVSRWGPLLLLGAGIAIGVGWPRAAQLLAALIGGVFAFAFYFVAPIAAVFVLPAGRAGPARRGAFALALAILAMLALAAHPHSAARMVQQFSDADD